MFSGLSMSILLAPLVVTAAVLLGARTRRRTASRHAERERLHRRFTDFVDANAARPMEEADIDRFLADTAGTEALCHGGAIPRLRLEMHDRALRLSRLGTALEQGWGGVERRAVIADGCEEHRAWFAEIARSLDARFDERRVAPIERIGRAIRA